ncbi:membrane progestin receptor delta isoform X1 [Accipiter gentilis]|uniref:membrane progestin receptor delta isoform X1 n=2 Tax=Astur gentilis TaxID=8957 RepID=UPI00210F4BB8|nr:membrane progestin receptor delta isoform X1 [Accipiter gentilis]XP_049660948.1 membrane progestin receptor delta isoform X1 [Accipiter gentilis]XP_049660949.1 membrane progestin receptor delta isoform X1 [Accipiter gentilis]
MLTIKLPQIFRIHQVPRIFWEDGIMSGYRHPKSSALDCVLSSFQMTNETVNIWTHFLPTWYFVWRFLVLSSSLDFCQEPYHWPLLIYLLLVCLYPFASSCAHTFSSMSARARHICYFCDYGALSLYSLGCAFAYGAYTMPDHWVSGILHHYFVPVAAFNSFVCTGLSCYSRFPELEHPRLSKVLRTAAFVYPFLYDNIPLFCRLLFCFWSNCTWNEAMAGYCYHLLFALLTGFLFASHLPERLAPGRFDYIGHSHQLFHICAVLGTHFQLEAILCDVCSRQAWLQDRLPAPGLPGTFGTAGLAFLGNVAIIGAFTAALPRAPGSFVSPPSVPTEAGRHMMLWGERLGCKGLWGPSRPGTPQNSPPPPSVGRIW